MVIYTARQEVLNLSKSKHIWPKELQLISRQTDKQVKQLASIYKKGSKISRVEVFEDNTLNQDGSRKSSRYLDLSKGPYTCEHELVSPKASALNRPELMVSSEKNENQPSDVPVAQIVIPTIKKIEISNSKVEAKSGVSEYKSKLTSVSSALEEAKNMPFRTKKMSLARSNVSGSSFGLQSRVSKIPHSN